MQRALAMAGSLFLLVVSAPGCRGVSEMMTPPSVVASRGPRCRPTPINPGPDLRPSLLAVESAFDQYLLLLPYSPDWQTDCGGDSAFDGTSRSLALQVNINVADWGAPGVQPDQYLQEVSRRVAQGYTRQGWAFRDSALVNPFNIPILQYRVESVDAQGMPYTQYNYWTMRPRQDGRVVELHIALNNPNPATLSTREGSLYYYLSNFSVHGQTQRMRQVEGKPPVYR